MLVEDNFEVGLERSMQPWRDCLIDIAIGIARSALDHFAKKSKLGGHLEKLKHQGIFYRALLVTLSYGTY